MKEHKKLHIYLQIAQTDMSTFCVLEQLISLLLYKRIFMAEIHLSPRDLCVAAMGAPIHF